MCPVMLTTWEVQILDQALGDVLQSRLNMSLMDINSKVRSAHVEQALYSSIITGLYLLTNLVVVAIASMAGLVLFL